MKHLIKLLQNYFQMVFTFLDQVITQKIGPLKPLMRMMRMRWYSSDVNIADTV